MELKKDPYVLGLAAVAIVCLTTALVLKAITWPEMVIGIGLIGLPSVFGRKADS